MFPKGNMWISRHTLRILSPQFGTFCADLTASPRPLLGWPSVASRSANGCAHGRPRGWGSMWNDGVGLSSVLGAGSAHLVRGVAGRMRALLTGVVLIWAAPVAAAPVADATWSTTPGSGDFNTAANWTSGFVPTGTAFFGPSTITGLLFTANTTLGGFTFNPGAFAYSFSNNQVRTSPAPASSSTAAAPPSRTATPSTSSTPARPAAPPSRTTSAASPASVYP